MQIFKLFKYEVHEMQEKKKNVEKFQSLICFEGLKNEKTRIFIFFFKLLIKGKKLIINEK